ncbi:BQ2448_2799 [Microbotryum intermedium]|uniref:BQ2448_2799 protein n=1 Tax=Microbotryum intermedium TaxID=269621 RepID=A0A238FGF3_9BASI|nr:BQ2448_2799 [Microbotryum intermedium]
MDHAIARAGKRVQFLVEFHLKGPGSQADQARKGRVGSRIRDHVSGPGRMPGWVSFEIQPDQGQFISQSHKRVAGDKEPLDPEQRKIATHTVHITEGSLEDYQAMLYWLRTGRIVFYHPEIKKLKVMDPSPQDLRTVHNQSYAFYLKLPLLMHANALSPNISPCFPIQHPLMELLALSTSARRRASGTVDVTFLPKLWGLTTIALDWFIEHLTPQMAAETLLTEWCELHREVKAKVLKYAYEHWPKVKASPAMVKAMSDNGALRRRGGDSAGSTGEGCRDIIGSNRYSKIVCTTASKMAVCERNSDIGLKTARGLVCFRAPGFSFASDIRTL